MKTQKECYEALINGNTLVWLGSTLKHEYKLGKNGFIEKDGEEQHQCPTFYNANVWSIKE